MSVIECPLCDREVAFEPGDAVLDCATCRLSVPVEDEEPPRLALAA